MSHNTVSQLTDASSGIHGRYSRYYIRTVRNDKKDPISKFLVDCGVPHEEDLNKNTQWVFSFPQKAPESSRIASEMTAIEQLEHYLIYNEEWAEHSVSITVYVREHEWLEVGAWVYKHFDRINGVSFLPYTDSVYKQSPYTEITEEEYYKWMETFPQVDFSKFTVDEHEDRTVGAQMLACSGGTCMLE